MAGRKYAVLDKRGRITYVELEHVSLDEARRRLIAYRKKYGVGPHGAAHLSYVIWPGHPMETQGAGGAAARIIKKLGGKWTSVGNHWGYSLAGIDGDKNDLG